jgi:hypothetical protein
VQHESTQDGGDVGEGAEPDRVEGCASDGVVDGDPEGDADCAGEQARGQLSHELYASLSLDGRTMTYGGGMRAPVRVVDLDPASWSVACRIAGRNLTRDEWATHLGDLAAYRATCPEFPVPGR